MSNLIKMEESFLKHVENTVGKSEIAPYEQFLLFLVFSKDLYWKQVKTRAICLGRLKLVIFKDIMMRAHSKSQVKHVLEFSSEKLRLIEQKITLLLLKPNDQCAKLDEGQHKFHLTSAVWLTV